MNQASRARILKEKRKRVCAYIEGGFGIIHAGDDSIFSDGVKVCFDPYENETFVQRETGEHILAANIIYINEHGVYASGVLRDQDLIFSRPIESSPSRRLTNGN